MYRGPTCIEGPPAIPWISVQLKVHFVKQIYLCIFTFYGQPVWMVNLSGWSTCLEALPVQRADFHPVPMVVPVDRFYCTTITMNLSNVPHTHSI